MKTSDINTDEQMKDRHILLAVDDSENAKRAVLYVADFLGGSPGFRVTLLNIIPEPSEDYFDSNLSRNEWLKINQIKFTQLLENYRNILIQSGFREDKVKVMIEVKYCPSIAECILDVQKKLGCCTVVIGRRGISKKEEFLFGSTSNSLLHSRKNCAIWVIE